MRWRPKKSGRHGVWPRERLRASRGYVSMTTSCCFRRMFLVAVTWDGLLDISSAWFAQDRMLRHRAGYKQFRHVASSLGGSQRRNRAQEPRRPMVRPGVSLVPGGTLPLAPGFARGTPFLGFFPGPPGVGFPLARSRPGGPRFGRMSEIIGGCKMSVARRHGIWTFGHFRVMVKKARRPPPPRKHYGLSHKDLSTPMEMDGGNCFNQ